MITLAEFLLNTPTEYNGHKQTDLGAIHLSDALQLIGDLEGACEDITDVFALELYREGEFSIVQKTYWSPGEHAHGHTDRIICCGQIRDMQRTCDE